MHQNLMAIKNNTCKVYMTNKNDIVKIIFCNLEMVGVVEIRFLYLHIEKI
jgi:hypothetical protein